MPENASPLLIVLSLVVSFAMLAILVGGSALWGLIVMRWQRGEAIIPFTPRRPVPWGFFDLFMGVLLTIGVTMFFLLSLKYVFNVEFADTLPMSERDKLSQMMLFSVATLTALGLLAALILLRTHGSLLDLGWSFAHVWEDILLGAKAFLVLALPTFAIQILLVQIWPSEHPLIEALKKEQNPQFVLMAIFMAVISAPLSEEFFFRTLFQGWLEKLFDPIAAQQPNFGNSILIGEQITEQPDHEQPVEATLVITDATNNTYANPYTAPVGEVYQAVLSETTAAPHVSSLADFVPLTISATIFALMHWGHGPDWVALLILALGLGYLYRRTHRMLPGIVVHFLLNSLSMCSLLVQIFQTPAVP